MMGAQSIGQGIASLGQSVASGIEAYAKKKKENKAMEANLKANINSLEGLSKIASSLSPQAQEHFKSTMQQLNDPSVPLTEKIALSESAQKTVGELINFGMQEKQKQEQVTIQQLGYDAAVSGRDIPLIYPKSVRAPAAIQSLAIQNQLANIAETRAKATAAGAEKPSKVVFPSPADAIAYGQKQLGTDKSLIAVPQSIPGGFSVDFQKAPDVAPDLVTPAVVSAQVPMIQASFNVAEAVPASIENIHQQKDLINSGEVPTGILAPVESFVNRLGALVGVKSSEAAAARTASYDKLLNQATFDAMKSSGLKATQLNTEKEWERFNKAMAAARENPKAAALAILDLNEKAQRAVLAEHNKKKQSGSYRKFLESSMIAYPDIPMPPEYSYKNPSAAFPAPTGGGINLSPAALQFIPR
jgi:hypothetical protein